MTRRACGIASPGCSMIGAVAGLLPRVRMAPVEPGTRMEPVEVRSGAGEGVCGVVCAESGTTGMVVVSGTGVNLPKGVESIRSNYRIPECDRCHGLRSGAAQPRQLDGPRDADEHDAGGRDPPHERKGIARR